VDNFVGNLPEAALSPCKTRGQAFVPDPEASGAAQSNQRLTRD
jgi:hypothetical protein